MFSDSPATDEHSVVAQSETFLDPRSGDEHSVVAQSASVIVTAESNCDSRLMSCA